MLIMVLSIFIFVNYFLYYYKYYIIIPLIRIMSINKETYREPLTDMVIDSSNLDKWKKN